MVTSPHPREPRAGGSSRECGLAVLCYGEWRSSSRRLLAEAELEDLPLAGGAVRAARAVGVALADVHLARRAGGRGARAARALADDAGAVRVLRVAAAGDRGDRGALQAARRGAGLAVGRAVGQAGALDRGGLLGAGVAAAVGAGGAEGRALLGGELAAADGAAEAALLTRRAVERARVTRAKAAIDREIGRAHVLT